MRKWHKESWVGGNKKKAFKTRIIYSRAQGLTYDLYFSVIWHTVHSCIMGNLCRKMAPTAFSCVRLPLLMRAVSKEPSELLLPAPDSGWCLPLEFNHFDTICKELSELEIFLFDSEAQCSLPADNERIELANGEISVVFMIRGLLASGYGRDRFQTSGLWCRARASFIGKWYSLELICMGFCTVQY